MGRSIAFLLIAVACLPVAARASDPCAGADSLLAAARAAAPTDTLRLADALLEAGRCHARSGGGDAARRAYDEGLALVTARTPADPLREAAFRHEIGAQYLGRRDPDGAAPYIAAALELRRRHLGERHPDTARTLIYRGVMTLQAGRGREARADYDEGLAIIEAAVGPVHADYLWALNLKASYLQTMKERAAARELYGRVLAGRAALDLPPDANEAWVLNNMAIGYEEEGRYVEAESLYTRSWEIRREVLGAVPLTGRSLVNRGHLLFLKGEYARARGLFEEAMRIFTAAGLDRDPDMGRCLRLLGMVYFWTGDVVSAEEQLGRARDVLGQRGPVNDRIGTMSGLAYCALQRGDARGAERWIRDALAVADGDSAVSIARGANLRIDLGRMLAARGAWPEADRAFADGIGMLEAAPVANPLNLGCAAYEQGEARLLAGRFREAADAIGRSLHLVEPILAPDHPQLVLCWTGLARASAGLGSPVAAAELARRAQRLQVEAVRTNLASLTERHALLLARSLEEATGLTLGLLAADPAPPLPAVLATWDGVAATRGLVQRELTGRRMGSAPSSSAGRLDAARVRLADLYLRGPAGETDAAFAGLVTAARHEREAAERAAMMPAHRVRRPDGDDAAIAALLAGLPADAALLAFALTPDSLGPGAAAGEGRCFAFVGRRGGSAAFVPLGARVELDAAIDAWRREAGDEAHRLRVDPAGAEHACAAAGRRLRRRAWDPLRAALGDARVVYLVPAGRLGLVAFDALPDDDGRYLAESGPAVVVVDHERDLRSRPAEVGRGLLALGDPDFGCCGEPLVASRGARRDAGDCRAIVERRFGPLPATRQEATALVERWRRHAPDAAVADCLLGTDASESALRGRAAGHRVLHLATHGFVVGESCRPEAWRGAGVLNAALGSGLVLSGADHWSAGTSTAADGLLTAEEVASLDLSGVDLAVLSACESGTGAATPYEGLIGLRRAFAIAGARHLVVGLWSVGDVESRDWFDAFYRAYLEDALPPQAAARAARNRLLADRRAAGRSVHPFYWAGFLTVGGGTGSMDAPAAADKH